jgi:hypothetical protein
VFNGFNGSDPLGALARDASGNLFGTTAYGGLGFSGPYYTGYGTVFEVVNTLPSWTVNQAGYHQTISSTGGTGGLTFAASGNLPPGLTMSSNGVLRAFGKNA